MDNQVCALKLISDTHGYLSPALLDELEGADLIKMCIRDSVSREVAQTKRYLTFEKARFGEDRVLATFDVSEDVEDTLVPAFVIQPIVENAVRHEMCIRDSSSSAVLANSSYIVVHS